MLPLIGCVFNVVGPLRRSAVVSAKMTERDWLMYAWCGGVGICGCNCRQSRDSRGLLV